MVRVSEIFPDKRKMVSSRRGSFRGGVRMKQSVPTSIRPYWINSPHFCTEVSAAPQGMIGTVDVEFFGDPSISLSE